MRNRVEGWLDVVASVGVCWLAGLRSWGLIGASVAAFFPVSLLVTLVTEKLWPTKLEPYKGGRIWG